MKLFLALAIAFAPALIHAKQYSFKLYSQQDGLRNQVINCLLQDGKGFLWAGTQNGLYRYDGSRFSYFGRADGLPDDTIQSLYESVEGTLWVGTRLGVATFDGQRRFVPDSVLGKTELFGHSNIVSDAAGRLYVGTALGLAIREKAPAPGKVRFQFTTAEAVHGVYVDPSDCVWFGAAGKLWHVENGRPVAMEQAAKVPVDRWDSMLVDSAGTLWARSSERLIFRLKGSQTFQEVPGVPHSPEFGSIYKTPDGHIFVPTDGGVMSYFEGRWERIGVRQGLASDEATCLLQDREGSVWVGLGGEGLERWLGFNQWESWTTADGLGSNIVWDIARDTSGTLWIATGNGLNAQEADSGNWALRSVRGLSVRTILDDAPHQELWYGANPGGVFRVDRRTGAVRRFGLAAGLTNDRIDRLFWGPGHDLWASTRAGLFRGKLSGDGVRFERQEPAYSDANEAFYGGLLDRQGRLWVGGTRGMVVLENGSWRRFSHSDGLAGDGVSQIAQTPDGAIWVGYLSNSGISRLRFDHERVHFDHFTTSNGLTSNGTVFVNADKRGWLWVGTDNGVDVYANSVWKHYGKVDGLAGDDCDSLAFFEDRDGSIWIGTSSGVSRFNAASAVYRDANQVYITGIAAGARTLDLNTINTIPYEDRSLLINFAAPTFINERSVRFRYRLLGLEQSWADADERWVRYPNLSAGSYNFQVLAQNAGGAWSREPATLPFRIWAPWWQTWKFRTFSAILLAGLGHLLWRFRIRYLMKKQKLLEALLSEAQTANRLKSEALEKVTKGEARERNRSHVLELIGSHQPLDEVLDAIINMVETDDPDTLCLILTIRDRRFRKGASRNFPVEFSRVFEGLAVNSPETCFAAAAFQREAIHVSNLVRDPLWTHYKDRLFKMGITCCRSAPILASSSEVLGTITYFRRKPFAETAGSLGLLENAERLASVAIEHLSLYEQLSYRAQYDLLTELPNRVFFQDRLCEAIVEAKQNSAKLWVLWIDLDGFKHVNDTLGHQAGDFLLKEVAARISGCLRRDDMVARMGGDEFTVLIESPDGLNVEMIIQKLIVAISNPISFGNREVFVTASVGVSIFPHDSSDAGELIKNADVAMYQVKRLGKNGYNFFVPEMAYIESARIEIESCLRHALVNREFEVYYQPQFQLDRTLAGFEALLRWTNPKLGAVSPGRFIPVAESTGLIVPIGQWVLEEACRQTAEWNAAGFPDFRMAVNVSAFQLARADFPESVAHLLAVMGVAPHQLELELTETSIMNDVAKSSAQLRALRQLGLTVSIDDFGTGYSSLSYLQRLPVDAIKIDQSFVRDTATKDSHSVTMIQAIVALAHGLNLRVVAEGVETEEQLILLRDLGCDLAQGFLLDQPLTKDDATALLAEHRRRSEKFAEPLMENLVGHLL